MDFSSFPGARHQIPKGDFLWQEGEDSNWVAYLEQGELEVVRYSLEGEAAVLNVLKPGQLLGEMSALDGSKHSATVRTKTAVAVRRCTTEQFIVWLRGEDRWLELVSSLCRRLRGLSDRFLENSLESVRTRLIRTILADAVDGHLQSTHQEMAERLGTTRESVSKALGELSKSGWLEVKRGRITVLKPGELQELIQ